MSIVQLWLTAGCIAASILVSFFLGYTVFRFESSASARPPIRPVTIQEVCTS